MVFETLKSVVLLCFLTEFHDAEKADKTEMLSKVRHLIFIQKNGLKIKLTLLYIIIHYHLFFRYGREPYCVVHHFFGRFKWTTAGLNSNFQIMFMGTVANLFVLLAARKMTSMNSSFGIITKNQSVCNMLMCLIFMLYVGPIQLRYVLRGK